MTTTQKKLGRPRLPPGDKKVKLDILIKKKNVSQFMKDIWKIMEKHNA